MADDFVYYSVNEEGTPYERTDQLLEAIERVRQFPNDTMVVCTPESPTDTAYRREMTGATEGWKTWRVEVQPALNYFLDITAKNPAHAVLLADQAPLPSASDMHILDGFIYIVEDEESGKRLYDSEEQDVPGSLEEALAYDEEDD